MNWTAMTESDFAAHVEKLEAGEFIGDGINLRVMKELLDELVTNKQAWSELAILHLLQGRFGAESKLQSAMAIKDGLKESGAVLSFTRTCIAHDRLRLLGAVADLGMPQALVDANAGQPYGRAMSPGGKWLDVLSNVGDPPRTSFLRQVGAFANAPTAEVLADILVRHDPKRAAFDIQPGDAGYPAITAALMRARINEHDARHSAGGSPQGSAPGAAPATVPARRRLGL